MVFDVKAVESRIFLDRPEGNINEKYLFSKFYFQRVDKFIRRK